MGGNAGVGKPFLAGVPLFGKIESLMPLSLGVSKPDGPGCNSPVQRAKHTPFLPSEDGKNPSGSTEV